MLDTTLGMFFQIFELGNIIEKFDQKVKNVIFFGQNHFFGIFRHSLVKIFKNIA